MNQSVNQILSANEPSTTTGIIQIVGCTAQAGIGIPGVGWHFLGKQMLVEIVG
jgi:hypothetical protein